MCELSWVELSWVYHKSSLGNQWLPGKINWERSVILERQLISRKDWRGHKRLSSTCKRAPTQATKEPNEQYPTVSWESPERGGGGVIDSTGWTHRHRPICGQMPLRKSLQKHQRAQNTPDQFKQVWNISNPSARWDEAELQPGSTPQCWRSLHTPAAPAPETRPIKLPSGNPNPFVKERGSNGQNRQTTPCGRSSMTSWTASWKWLCLALCTRRLTHSQP